MEGIQDDYKNIICISCLAKNDERMLHSYNLQNAVLKSILQVDSICLCYLCEYRTQNIELFIQNVQSNQILLENIHNLTDTSLENFKSQMPLNLTYTILKPMELTGIDNVEEDTYTVLSNCRGDVKVKQEMKDEEFNESGAEFPDDDHDLDQYVKEEDEYPLQKLKEELEEEGISINSLRKSTRKGKTKKKLKKEKVLKSTDIDEENDVKLLRIHISRDQCMEERNKMAVHPKYVNSVFKCHTCLKGFSFEACFKKHKEKHSEKNGDYECDICTQRFDSQQRLQGHQISHYIRYGCSECGVRRANRALVREHIRTHTDNGNGLGNVCPHCKKTFSRSLNLRKHIRYAHGPRLRTRCPHCDKLYATKESLKAHQLAKHPQECSSSALLLQHGCEECGATFSAASKLRVHRLRHTSEPGAYCVECNKSFKTNAILQHHLKTARAHTKYLDLPLSCLHCDKRFAIRRDVDRHMNRVHLNIKPFRCEKCDKAYSDPWSLAQHTRISHEGYRRPLNFPCPMCDKVFDRNQILKGHMRTHTGERPYQCTKCPAQFSQSSILNTHIRLIHLRLTRDGRPKQRHIENNSK